MEVTHKHTYTRTLHVYSCVSTLSVGKHNNEQNGGFFPRLFFKVTADNSFSILISLNQNTQLLSNKDQHPFTHNWLHSTVDMICVELVRWDTLCSCCPSGKYQKTCTLLISSCVCMEVKGEGAWVGGGLDNSITGYTESCSMDYSHVVYRTLITYMCYLHYNTLFRECHLGVCRIIQWGSSGCV